MNLEVQLAQTCSHRLLLKNPVIAASGTFGYGTEYSSMFDIQRLGAIVCKGTTLESREGNCQPRLKETPAGLLNSIGLQNIGVEAVIREKAPIWKGWQVPVIVNIAAEKLEDYVKLTQLLNSVPGISGLEINISCPNMLAGGIEFGTSSQAAAEVTKAVREATTLPILVKLTPSASNVIEVAMAVAKAGANTISLVNTFPGMAIDTSTRKPFLGNLTGGLSGPAIKPIAVYMVYHTAKALDIPIVGCGGIISANDALEFIMAGASAVQVGTANLTNPQATLDVLEGIEQFMKQEGIQDISEIIGAAH